MRKLVVFSVLLLFIGYTNAQVVENPVFDRTDVPAFRIEKVEMKKDTTCVYCSYSAEEHSWANISTSTYLENIRNGDRYPIINVTGIPFGPEKKHFTDASVIEVVLFFPLVSTDKINIIEDEEERAFNIYGIDLAHSYESSFTNNDIIQYYNSSIKKQEEQDYTQALDYTLKQLEASNYVMGIRSLASAASMFNLTMEYSRINNCEKVIEWGEKAIDILRSLPQDSISQDILARTYWNMSSAYSLTKQLEKARQYEGLSLRIRETIEGKDQYNESLAQAFLDLALDYSEIDSLDMSIKYSMIAKQYLDNHCKAHETIYIDNLYKLSGFFKMNNQNDSAIYYYQQTYDLMKEANDFHYADVLTLLSLCYFTNNDLQKAIDFLLLAIEEKLRMEKYADDFYCSISDDYKTLSDFFVVLFYRYDQHNEYGSEIGLANKYFSLYDCTDDNYFSISHGLLKALDRACDYEQGILFGEQIIQRYKSAQSNVTIPWRIYAILSQIYQGDGNFVKAYYLGAQAVELIKSESIKMPSDDSDYLQRLIWIAGFYSNFGETDKSIDYQKQVLNISKQIYGENSEKVGLAIHNLAFYYGVKGDYKKAIELYGYAAKLYKELLGDDNPSYFVSLKNMAGCLSEMGEYGKALNTFENVLVVEKSIYGDISPQVAITLAEIGEIYGKLHDNVLELESKEAAYRILLELQSIAPFDPHFIIRGLARAYFKGKNYSNSSELICKELKSSHKGLISEILNLPVQTRGRLWYRDQQLFIQDLPRLAYVTMSDSLINLMYNYSALFGKGLILNTNRSISQIALESDSITQDNYHNLKYLEGLREAELRKDEVKRQYDIEDLNLKIQTIESTLLTSSNDSAQIINYLNLSWKDVQKHLEDNALAIEFFSVQYPDEQSDSVIYMALTIKKDYAVPKLTHLFYLNELPKWSDNSKDSLYNLIWRPLEEELHGVNKVYFSTWYSLNTIPVENLPSPNGSYMSDLYDMYRLSSTRELVYKRPCVPITDMAIYGGLDYDGIPQNEANVHEDMTDKLPVIYRGVTDSIIGRGGVEYLPFTLTEAKDIEKEAIKHRIKCKIYSDVAGTEESFKNLSDSKVSLIHIATHGIYLGREDVKNYANNNNYMFLLNHDDGNALYRTFMVMSGGNRLSKRDSIPYGIEDGILTAKEISILNLNNVDLVVLSACQSGLGDSSPEGVIGLQHGFKMAGVKTILMTLEKIDDEATQIFMSEFYKELFNGKTKYQSFKAAQKHLRKIEDGKYDDPKYWASFIMLDGLN